MRLANRPVVDVQDHVPYHAVHDVIHYIWVSSTPGGQVLHPLLHHLRWQRAAGGGKECVRVWWVCVCVGGGGERKAQT